MIDILNDLFEFNQTLFALSIFCRDKYTSNQLTYTCFSNRTYLHSSYLYHIQKIQNIVFTSSIKKDKHVFPFGYVDYNNCGTYSPPISPISFERGFVLKYNNFSSTEIQSHNNLIHRDLGRAFEKLNLNFNDVSKFSKLYSISFEYKN